MYVEVVHCTRRFVRAMYAEVVHVYAERFCACTWRFWRVYVEVVRVYAEVVARVRGGFARVRGGFALYVEVLRVRRGLRANVSGAGRDARGPRKALEWQTEC